MTDRNDFPTRQTGLVRLALRLVVVALVVVAIHLALDWVADKATEAGNEKLMIGMLSVVLLGYAVLIAVPFMPGIEIGVSLLILQGASIAPFVFIATVLGLILAFLAGRFTPYAWLHAVLRDLRWKSACDLVERLEPMGHDERMTHLVERLPTRARPWIKAGRYALLAVLLNLPGNALIGGGGGIAFVAGFSRLFRPWVTFLVIAAAVLPVPLAVWLSGVDVLF